VIDDPDVSQAERIAAQELYHEVAGTPGIGGSFER
jgi:hypothetical protein